MQRVTQEQQKGQLIQFEGENGNNRGGFLKEMPADLNCEQSVGIIKAEKNL